MTKKNIQIANPPAFNKECNQPYKKALSDYIQKNSKDNLEFLIKFIRRVNADTTSDKHRDCLKKVIKGMQQDEDWEKAFIFLYEKLLNAVNQKPKPNNEKIVDYLLHCLETIYEPPINNLFKDKEDYFIKTELTTIKNNISMKKYITEQALNNLVDELEWVTFFGALDELPIKEKPKYKQLKTDLIDGKPIDSAFINRVKIFLQDEIKNGLLDKDNQKPTISNSNTSSNSDTPMKPLKIFISYSSINRELRKIMEKLLKEHLSSAKFEEIWTDGEISTGEGWNDAIQKNLASSDIGILLVSPQFLKSKYCSKEELQTMIEIQRKRGYIIFPVLLTNCNFKDNDFFNATQFFKTYKSEYEIKNRLERDNLMPFDELIDLDNDRLLNNYFVKLVEELDKAINKQMPK